MQNGRTFDSSSRCTGVNKIQTREFIHQKFLEYYRENIESIQPPTSLEKREFAVLLLKERAMLRHRGFKNVEILRDFLQSVVSSDVYYSSSYYEKPDAEEMDAKGWIGADLIFDIDADHIPTACDKRHDVWACKSCGTPGRGPKPEKCPKCQLQKFSDISWPCEICLEYAKEETMKLIDMLEEDFGFSSNEMILAFSGHRGYHVHIEDEAVRKLAEMGYDPEFGARPMKRTIQEKVEDVLAKKMLSGEHKRGDKVIIKEENIT